MYNDGGIENGGADSVDPDDGGGRVCGSFLGGNWKRDNDGKEN